MIPLEEIVVIDGLGTFSRLAGILFALAYGVPQLGRLRFGAIPLPGWAYLAWAVVSLGWAVDPGVAWSSLLTLIQLFLIAFLIANLVVDRPILVRRLLWIYTASATLSAAVGIYWYLTQGSAIGRAAAFSGQDPAQFAAVLLPAVAFALYATLGLSRPILGGVISLVLILGTVVSGTRGAWLALGMVVLVLAVALPPRRRLAATGFVAVIVVAVLLIPGVAQLLSQRAESALSSGGEGRTAIWTVGAILYETAPVTGVGYANFPVVYSVDIVRESGVQNRAAFVEGRGPHNLLVGTLVELGPIGVVLLALFLAILLARRGWGPDWPAVQAGVAGLIVMAMFLDIVGNRKQIWLFVGLAAGLIWHRARHQEPIYPETEARLSRSRTDRHGVPRTVGLGRLRTRVGP